MFAYGNISSSSSPSSFSCLTGNLTLFDCRMRNIRKFYEDSVVLKDSSLVSVILLICLSLTINLIVITSYFRSLGLHTPNNVHVVSLAVADGLVSAVSMPLTAIRMSGNQQLITVLMFYKIGILNIFFSLIFGTIFCSWWPFFDLFLHNISVFNLVNIAIDR